MKLSSLLNPDLIFFDIPGATREEVYRNIMLRMSYIIRLPYQPQKVVADMMAREDSIRIVYERGFAFPHVRYPMLEDLDIAVGILKTPVRLKENDREPTKLVVCSMISENTSVVYLKALAAFSKFFMENAAGLDELVKTGRPDYFIEYLFRKNVVVQPNLCAENVMRKDVRCVRGEDPISKALDIIAIDKYSEIPVVDGENRLTGLISPGMIFRSAVPDYIMMLDNLNFLSRFEPFESLLKKERESRVSDTMQPVPPKLIIRKDTPLIQLTITLLKEKGNTLFVLDDENRLIGAVSYIDLVANVLRG